MKRIDVTLSNKRLSCGGRSWDKEFDKKGERIVGKSEEDGVQGNNMFSSVIIISTLRKLLELTTVLHTVLSISRQSLHK